LSRRRKTPEGKKVSVDSWMAINTRSAKGYQKGHIWSRILAVRPNYQEGEDGGSDKLTGDRKRYFSRGEGRNQ